MIGEDSMMAKKAWNETYQIHLRQKNTSALKRCTLNKDTFTCYLWDRYQIRLAPPM
jgi:hypothetical protein